MCFVKAQELKAAASVASKDRSRKILTGVCVEIKDDEYSIISTDSYCALVVNRRELDNPKKYVVESEYPARLKSSDEVVEFREYDDSHVFATIISKGASGSRVEIWPLIEGQFPVVRKLFDDETEPNNGSYGIGADLCSKICKAMITATKTKGREEALKVESTSPVKPIRFKSSLSPNIEALIMPVRFA